MNKPEQKIIKLKKNRGNNITAPLQRIWKFHPKHYIWIILVLAAAARIIYVAQINDYPFFSTPVGDEEAYNKTAQLIVNGDLLAGGRAFYQDVFYPYFLSFIYVLFGSNILIPKLIQIFLGLISCLLIFNIARSIFGLREGITAGILSSIYPLFYFFEAQLLKSSLVVLFTLGMLYLIILYKNNHSNYLILAAGLFSGLSIVGQGHSYFLVPFVLIWLVFFNKECSLKSNCVSAAIFMAGIFIIISPVTMRNYFVSGDFVLTTYQGGTNFYIGNNETATGIYQPLKEGRELPPYEEIDAIELAEKESGRKLKPSEISNFWFGKGIAFIKHNPGKYASVLLKKVLIYLNALEVPDVVDYYFIKENSFLFRIPLLNFGVICPLALLGIVLSWKTRNEKTVLIYFFALGTFLSLVLFYIFSRYRLQNIPFMIILASFSIVKLFDWIKASQYRKLLMTAPILLVLLYISNIKLNLINAGLGYGLMGSLAMENKDYVKAVDYLKTALSRNLNNISISSKLRNDIAKCYLEMRDYDNALAEYYRVIELQKLRSTPPDENFFTDIQTNIGLAYQKKREYKKARTIFEDLKDKSPDKLTIRTNLGTVYKKMKLFKLAINEYTYVIERDTMNLVALNNLANIYRDGKDFDEAMKYYLKGLEIDPRNPAILNNIERLKALRGGSTAPDWDPRNIVSENKKDDD